MLQGISYVPLLYTKGSEVEALARLDDATRDRIFPIVAIRPWPNTKQFDAIVPQLDRALAGRRHGFELDRHKRGRVSTHPCAEQFEALFSTANSFENYYNLVATHPDRVPVLRDERGYFTQLDGQFAFIENMHRGVIVRIESGYTVNLEELLASGHLVADDVIFAVDAGWSLDVLQQEAWASSMVSLITEWDESAEIVCLSSSFPNSFSHIVLKGAFSIDERELYDRLVRRHNSANLIYGDWGSTRRSEEQGGGTHYNRIDTARRGEWVSFRQTGEEVGYQVIAQRLLDDDIWNDLPDCWGKYRMECTALDVPHRIVGNHSAILSRINMHITAQSVVGGAAPEPDIPYVDPF